MSKRTRPEPEPEPVAERPFAENAPPRVGDLVRFRADFGEVGAARIVFRVDGEPSREHESLGGRLIVPLVTTQQRRKGYRLANVTDLVPADVADVRGSDLLDGAVVYVCGRWQVLTNIRPDGPEHFRADHADGHSLGRSGSVYAVRVCPACGQQITVTADGYTTECGGQGNGGCEALCEGRDPAVQDAHCLALDYADGGR